MKFSVKGLGLALGVLWGVCLFVWTLVIALTTVTWGKPMLDFLVGFYPYYELSVTGAFVGLVAGFVDGFVGGALVAWLYNLFSE